MKSLLLANRRVLFRAPQGSVRNLRDVLSPLARCVLFLVTAFLLSLSFDATAQIARPFTIRYSTNNNGDIKLIGNTNMTCPASADCTSAQQGVANPTGVNNNDFAMIDVDIDGDPSTFNSSSATLNLPGGSTVLFAGLYWGAESASAQRGQVLF